MSIVAYVQGNYQTLIGRQQGQRVALPYEGDYPITKVDSNPNRRKFFETLTQDPRNNTKHTPISPNEVSNIICFNDTTRPEDSSKTKFGKLQDKFIEILLDLENYPTESERFVDAILKLEQQLFISTVKLEFEASNSSETQDSVISNSNDSLFLLSTPLLVARKLRSNSTTSSISSDQDLNYLKDLVDLHRLKLNYENFKQKIFDLNEDEQNKLNQRIKEIERVIEKDPNNVKDYKTLHKRIESLKEATLIIGHLGPNPRQIEIEELRSQLQSIEHDYEIAKIAYMNNLPVAESVTLIKAYYPEYYNKLKEVIHIDGAPTAIQPSSQILGTNAQLRVLDWLRIGMQEKYPKMISNHIDNEFNISLKNIQRVRAFDDELKPEGSARYPDPFESGSWAEFRLACALLRFHSKQRDGKEFQNSPRFILKIIPTKHHDPYDDDGVDFWLKTFNQEKKQVEYIPIDAKFNNHDAHGKAAIIKVKSRTLTQLENEILKVLQKHSHYMDEVEYDTQQAKRQISDNLVRQSFQRHKS